MNPPVEVTVETDGPRVRITVYIPGVISTTYITEWREDRALLLAALAIYLEHEGRNVFLTVARALAADPTMADMTRARPEWARALAGARVSVAG
jgi:hypothetical protein